MKHLKRILRWLFQVDNKPDHFGETNTMPVIIVCLVVLAAWPAWLPALHRWIFGVW